MTPFSDPERKSLRAPPRKLTPHEVALLLSDYADGIPQAQLAKRFGCALAVVRDLVKAAGVSRG